jgi:hypothetical protein
MMQTCGLSVHAASAGQRQLLVAKGLLIGGKRSETTFVIIFVSSLTRFILQVAHINHVGGMSLDLLKSLSPDEAQKARTASPEFITYYHSLSQPEVWSCMHCNRSHMTYRRLEDHLSSYVVYHVQNYIELSEMMLLRYGIRPKDREYGRDFAYADCFLPPIKRFMIEMGKDEPAQEVSKKETDATESK